jgi:predicted nucleic acid-binding protein
MTPYCKLVIPDTGPLISLARADSLHLLRILNKRIVIPLAVKYEFSFCMSISPSELGIEQAKTINRYLLNLNVEWRDTQNSQALFDAGLELKRQGTLLNEAEKNSDVGQILKIKTDIKQIRAETKNLGEKSIFEILDLLEEEGDIGIASPAMVLFDDKKLFELRGMRPNNKHLPGREIIHLVTTRGMLVGLEKLNLIPSAQSIIAKIEEPDKSGRASSVPDFSELNDVPTVFGSSWIPSPENNSDFPISNGTADTEACARLLIQSVLDPRESAGEIERLWGERAPEIRETLRRAASNPEAYGITEEAFEAWGQAHGLGRVRMCPGPDGPVVTTVYDDF